MQAGRPFSYRYLDGHGRLVAASVEAFSQAEAMAKIRAMGRVAVEVGEAGPAAGPPAAPRLSSAATEHLVAQLARLTAASVSLDRALDMVASAGGGSSVAVAKAVRARLRAGASVTQAFSGSPEAFDMAALALIRAGESAGDLSGAFAQIAALLGRQNAVRSKIRSALIYPAVVLTTAVAVVMLILLQVIPQFEAMVADSPEILPVAARVVFWASGAVQTIWPALLAGAAGAAALLLRAARAGRLESAILQLVRHVPSLGGTIGLIGPSRLARLAGTLITRNVSLIAAIDITATAAPNAELAAAMAQTRAALQQGTSLRAALAATGRFPPLVLQLLQVGEETGRIGPMLVEAADILDERIDQAMQRFLILFQPIILVGLGLVVGGLLYGLFSAILSVNQAISPV